MHKANLLNQKGQQALEKVRKNQRRLELQSVKTFKANMKEVEDRRMRAQQLESGKARQDQRDFI